MSPLILRDPIKRKARQIKIFKFWQKVGILPTEIFEIDLFIFGLSFIFLLIDLPSQLLLDLLKTLLWGAASAPAKLGLTMPVFFLVLYLLLSAPFCIHIALTQRSVSKFQRAAIKFFFIAFNATLALAIGVHAWQNPTFLNKALALWQFIRAFVFLFFSDLGEHYSLPRRHARHNEIILATVVIVIVFALGYWRNCYWATTFSTILLLWGLTHSFISQYPELQKVFTDSPAMGRRIRKPNI